MTFFDQQNASEETTAWLSSLGLRDFTLFSLTLRNVLPLCEQVQASLLIDKRLREKRPQPIQVFHPSLLGGFRGTVHIKYSF